MNIRDESARCLLCANAKCTNVCPQQFDPARMIRAVRFDNAECAAKYINCNICAECDGKCESACMHPDFPIRIRKIAEALPDCEYTDEPSLEIDFMGVKCENPFFLSSSIVAGNYEMCANAFRMGWAGAVFKTIGFIKPDETSPRFDAVRKEGTPFVGFKNLEQISDHSLEENLSDLRRLKTDFPNKVIVASIMGETDDEWTSLAKLVTDAGADIIECNFSCPQMVGEGLGSDVGQNPELVRHYTECVKKGASIPVIAKMTPNIGNMEVPAIAAVNGGADGIAAINTIKCITGFDLENMEPHNAVSEKTSVSGYSGKAVKPIALRFICDMAKCDKLKGVPLSGIGGIETWHDAAEFIVLGCENVQVTTAVMQYGYRIIDDLISGLKAYMKRKGISRLEDLVGIGLNSVTEPDKLDRTTVTYPVFDKKRCIGCGRCYLSCRDGGHQAISISDDGKPVFEVAKCVGCHLCSLVCPIGTIGKSKRVKKKT
ncbi:MAG: NAD-dependent dihydropyrimidine dehydrogenase subunit PreA [Clostridiales bacterium]|nr:NAD-dependent dihydropyrimidine dehydrogenase subunit PreA [Clostridiales bacterium]